MQRSRNKPWIDRGSVQGTADCEQLVETAHEGLNLACSQSDGISVENSDVFLILPVIATEGSGALRMQAVASLIRLKGGIGRAHLLSDKDWGSGGIRRAWAIQCFSCAPKAILFAHRRAQ